MRFLQDYMTALRTALNIGSIVLVAVTAWLFVRTVMGFLNPESLYAPEPIVAPAPAVAQAGLVTSYDFSSDPFSATQTLVEDTAPEELTTDAPETSLNLTFQGGTTEGAAIITLQDGRQQNFKIDEEIMNGVSLNGLGKDFVTLDVNGEIQKLTLERAKLEQQAGKSIVTLAQEPAFAPNLSSKPTSSPSRAQAENLFSNVDISPYFDKSSGKSERRGFKIKPRSGADLSAFGLKSGDVLTRIGSVQLDQNVTNIPALRDLISTGAAQDIEVLRNGAPITIRIGQ